MKKNERAEAGRNPLTGEVNSNSCEKIKVYVQIVGGKTVCICHANGKRCSRNCERETVTRDKYYEWEKTFRRNKYGK